MMNYGDLAGCYPPRPTASTDNTLLDLHNSSQVIQPHSLIVHFRPRWYLLSTKIFSSEKSKVLTYVIKHGFILFYDCNFLPLKMLQESHNSFIKFRLVGV